MKKHSKKTIFCLVQFKGVAVDALPRMYLATPSEIASWLKAAAAGRGDTILYEEHVWTNRAKAAGTIDRIPAAWKFTEERLNEISVGAESGKDRRLTGPPHTTHRAGPQWAVHEQDAHDASSQPWAFIQRSRILTNPVASTNHPKNRSWGLETLAALRQALRANGSQRASPIG
ncbi:MAG: hypothetical protein IPI02_08620 [Sterolibacteriaceae bacterium]|nr:hypothetical protein [Sterolibacteriaceae bacterium]